MGPVGDAEGVLLIVLVDLMLVDLVDVVTLGAELEVVDVLDFTVVEVGAFEVVLVVEVVDFFVLVGVVDEAVLEVVGELGFKDVLEETFVELLVLELVLEVLIDAGFEDVLLNDVEVFEVELDLTDGEATLEVDEVLIEVEAFEVGEVMVIPEEELAGLEALDNAEELSVDEVVGDEAGVVEATELVVVEISEGLMDVGEACDVVVSTEAAVEELEVVEEIEYVMPTEEVVVDELCNTLFIFMAVVVADSDVVDPFL